MVEFPLAGLPSPQWNWKVYSIQGEEAEKAVYLGTFFGYIDELAFALADRAGRSLRFEPCGPLNMTPKCKNVVVEIAALRHEADSKEEEVALFKDYLKDRPVAIKAAQYYAGVELTTGNRTAQEIVEAVLGRLTPEELNAILLWGNGE